MCEPRAGENVFLLILIILIAEFSLYSPPASARENILTGSLSTSFNYTDRNYSSPNLAPSYQGNDSTAVVLPADDRTGDRRDYAFSPQLAFSSRGQTDLFKITYSPGFVYDDLDYTTRVDHSFGLTANKHLSQRWFVSINDNYFLGNDPARETALQTVGTSALEERQQPTVQTTDNAQETADQTLDERVGSRRYWRNTADLQAEYTYGQGRLIGAGYTFEVLRNDNNDLSGYTEYDRHSLMAHVAHRFNAAWQLDFRGNYSKGIFDEPALVSATPTDSRSSLDTATIDVLRPESNLSSDLQEYDGTTRLNYSWSNHATFFVSDDSKRTDYDDPLRRDNWTHNVAVGLDYHFDPHFYVALSGGPTFSKLGDQDWETDYNVSASLTRLFLHASLNIHVSKYYDVQNFDGRGNGLTDTWEAGADYTHKISDHLSLSLLASYRDDRRLQYPYVNTLVASTGELATTNENLAPLVEGFDYHEKIYTGGIDLSWNFLRWYTLSGGYRYTKDETELTGSSDYDEHRVFVQLTVAKDLFRW